MSFDECCEDIQFLDRTCKLVDEKYKGFNDEQTVLKTSEAVIKEEPKVITHTIWRDPPAREELNKIRDELDDLRRQIAEIMTEVDFRLAARCELELEGLRTLLIKKQTRLDELRGAPILNDTSLTRAITLEL